MNVIKLAIYHGVPDIINDYRIIENIYNVHVYIKRCISNFFYGNDVCFVLRTLLSVKHVNTRQTSY